MFIAILFGRMGQGEKTMELDRYDRQILAALQRDGRISNQELAEQIGLSPSPCLRRVRALEEAGLIRGYRALLDADYQLKVVVKDMDGYQELLLNRITRIQGVTGVHSSFVLRRVVDNTAL